MLPLKGAWAGGLTVPPRYAPGDHYRNLHLHAQAVDHTAFVVAHLGSELPSGQNGGLSGESHRWGAEPNGQELQPEHKRLGSGGRFQLPSGSLPSRRQHLRERQT